MTAIHSMKNFLILTVAVSLSAGFIAAADSGFRAGASTIDISPRKLPAIRNGGFLEAVWSRNDDPLYARSLVLDDGKESIVLCVVDSCMLPADECDAIKALVAERTEIPLDRILISADRKSVV